MLSRRPEADRFTRRAGGALELKLLERLELRVQSTFVQVDVARVAASNAPGAVVTGTSLSFIPSPGLELRLYL